MRGHRTKGIPLSRVDYDKLSARQQETYNYQKVSAVLADYGNKTIRLSEDWESADFIAYHNDGRNFQKIQLKGRLVLDTKYIGKDIYVCFPYAGDWYIYPMTQRCIGASQRAELGNSRGR